MKRILSIVVALYAMILISGSVFAAKDDKVDVCHNLGNGGVILITVSASSAEAHEGHGDVIGEHALLTCLDGGTPPVE